MSAKNTTASLKTPDRRLNLMPNILYTMRYIAMETLICKLGDSHGSVASIQHAQNFFTA